MVFDEKRHLYEALTRANYFPNQKASIGEMPPCFSTINFTPEIAEALAALDEPPGRGGRGYDQVEFGATRHNNVPRTLAIIHPKAYSLLVKNIHDNWDSIRHIRTNERSAIKPDSHTDGRVMIMNYEDPDTKASRSLTDGFGCKFRVQTDIASCFHSIYSHAIPWAIIGFEEAKRNLGKGNKDGWYDSLDKFQRKVKRNETQGIPIGPATSSIVVELILGRVDQKLEEKSFQFRRHIDDYVCFCKTYEEAQHFLQILGYELSRFKLNLNLHKTSIVELPAPISDSWVALLNAALPSTIIDDKYGRRKLLSSELMQYLDYAVRLNKETADGSVIKYAVSTIIHHIDEDRTAPIFSYILNLSWYFPVLLPYLDLLMSRKGFDATPYGEQLNEIIFENARHRRSDGMAWPLYFLSKFELPLEQRVADAVVDSGDCVAILSVYAAGSSREKIIEFCNALAGEDDYEKDRYWLLLYQLFREGVLADPYKGDACFGLLKDFDVNFMPGEGETRAEGYCGEIANPFIEEKDKPTFAQWMKQA
jgi:hypothetical protein